MTQIGHIGKWRIKDNFLFLNPFLHSNIVILHFDQKL